MILLGLDSILSSGDINLGGFVQKCYLSSVSVTVRSDAGPSLGRNGDIVMLLIFAIVAYGFLKVYDLFH